MTFKVRENTGGWEVIYKPPIKEIGKIKLSVFGSSFSRFWLNILSLAFSDLKPCKMAFRTKKIKKIYATRKNIEKFLLKESFAFMNHHNRQLSKHDLKRNICEVLKKTDLNQKIELPEIIEQVHKKSIQEYMVLERTVYQNLVDYLEGLSADKMNLPLSFCVTEKGNIIDANNKDFSMQLVVRDGKLVIEPDAESIGKDLHRPAQVLCTSFELKGSDPKPIEILKAAIQDNIANEFKEFLHRKMPCRKESNFKEVYLKKDGEEIPMDMHKISMNGCHYIASPIFLEDTASMFWSSVFQEKTPLIVKLTGEQPCGSEKLYWPNKEGQTWSSKNPLIPSVTCKKIVQVNNELIKREFEVSNGKETFRVTQLDFLGWKDKSIPEKDSFLKLMDEVDHVCPKTTAKKRILVHCIAGIGRTGTFITAHSSRTLPKSKRTEKNLFKMIMDLRKQRPYPMVETSSQYAFLKELWR